MKITFLLGFYPNQRMNKRMRLLIKDHEVSLIYWKKSENDGAYGTDIAVADYKCIDIQFKEGSLKERLFALQRFKKEAEKELNKIQPDCIYVQNLDLLLFAEKYKRKNGNALKLVYEISDINDILIQPQEKALKKAAQVYLQNAEKTACKNVDLLCYTSPAFFEERYGALVPKEKSMYLPNIPNMTYFDGYIPHPWEDFTIGYIGTVRYEKQLRLMLDAAKEAGIASMIAGGLASGGSRGSQVNLRGLQEDYSDTEFIGAFDYPSQIANIYGRINVSFAVYDTNLRNVKVALPNKLYEAIRCRIPLIVAPGTYLAEIVERLGIGLASNNLQEITHFLIHLREDKQYYKQFQDACEKHQDEIDADMINSTFCSWFKE